MSRTKKTYVEKKQEFTDPPVKISPDMFYGVRLDDHQCDFANAIWDKNIDIVFVNARAGTGKTFVSIGTANMLVQYGMYSDIIYIMSPYGEKKQGWLPGNIDEKSAVYFEQLYQALIKCNINPYTAIKNDINNQKNGNGYISCITDTYLRGWTIDNAVVIIDEAQNYTVSQLKTILTRVGKNAKVIVIGHTLQCDLEDQSLSGFAKYIDHFKEHEKSAVCTLEKNYRGWISQHADSLED